MGEDAAPPVTHRDGSDRLHAFDAVRGFALLLGVVLHTAASFVDGFPIPGFLDRPETVPTVIFYVIHIFRMSAFFLMAGFFGRLLLERRGTERFVKDRLRRIALPLAVALILLPPLGAGAAILGSLPHGGIPWLLSQLPPPDPVAASVAPSGPNLAIFWFLYYLLFFYALALAARAIPAAIDREGRLMGAVDRLVRFVMRGAWAAVLVALPLAALLWTHEGWGEWTGLPAPLSFMPDSFTLLSYGLPFGLGWLLHRQIPLLLGMQRYWLPYLVLALVFSALSLSIIGIAVTPHWARDVLTGTPRAAYALCYALAIWFWVFGLVGAALRFLSRPNAWVRYLSDASYWVYLAHIFVVTFFLVLLRPYDWHWAVKMGIVLGGAAPILLLSYHYMVRSTFIGATLNGRRYPRTRAVGEPERATA